MGEPRIRRMFDAVREQKRPGLIVFLTAGFPDMEATLELVPALVAAGADAVELGVPFSDPLAEGPVIQESSFRALQNGTSLEDCLNAAETLREQIPDTPLILMGYYNPIHTYGLVKFTQRCHQAGVDGLIAVDLPGFEAAPLMAECRTRDISMIPLLAPTSTDGSIQDACAGASGFIYCISVTGVTGVRDQVSGRSFELLDRVKAHTNLPLAVGFGISSRAHVEAVGKTAEAAVVGSALIKVMLESPREELVERTSRFVAELAGVSLPA
ncbi:MAG: tryptophan synthase subunit alpha [Chloroflexi bacterium]|nr:tryptophan synthase subunit alpha [Chloroflexota bacterium]MCI0800625.1 tryptophan synthase subunit alpha [Chloroflexota bacterium]MCI0810737.1 tryptophan synthase subunit alpha [Chloroflexota bacterium]MCI0829541.1 tryptophan synthase subunit alpha [Chloroflexota bacterium]